MSTNFTEAAIAAAAKTLALDPAVIQAVIAVEASGSGFLPDGRPKVLFEAHLFDRDTGGKWRASHPSISSAKWDRTLYRGGSHEWQRLSLARSLNVDAADRSASWGAFQILGRNHADCGHRTVRSFVVAMHQSHDAQLAAFVSFLRSNPKMLEALRGKDWGEFAKRYNGPGFKANRYDTKLAAAFARAVAAAQEEPPEKARIKATQAALNTHQPGLLVDGFDGRVTASRLAEFQQQQKLPVTQELDHATLQRLNVDVGRVLQPIQAVAAAVSTGATAVAPLLGMDWRLAAVIAAALVVAAGGYLIYRRINRHG